jgi:drug/metabolite transporter (DMT)-like permease
LILSAIWGASYMFIEVGLRDFDPVMVAFLRVAFAAIALAPVALARDAFRGLGDRLPLLVLLAAVQAAGPWVLLALGQEEVTSSLAGILVASTPIFTALLAIKVDQEERAQGLRLVGVLIGIGGVAMLLGLDLGGSAAALLGGLAIVLASLGYAIGGFMVKHRFADVQPIGVATAVMIASSALLLVPAAAFALPSGDLGVAPVLSVITLGVAGTGIAFVIFYELMTTVGPARTFIVTYLAPAFAIVYGATLLSEEITAATIGGLALIVGGSYLAAEGRLPGASRPPAGAVPPPPGGEAAAQTGSALRLSRSAAGRGS